MSKSPDHDRRKRVLAISSQVVRGHVGLSAIVPALQAMQHEVWPLPTVLLSNHPAHAHVAGQRVPVSQLDAMLDALEANGWLGIIDAVLTGYLPSMEHVALAARAIERVRRYRSDATIVVDPVLGDEPKGLYIEETAAAAIRDRLVPLADIVTPNRFELGWLTGRMLAGDPRIPLAASRLGAPCVVVTSAMSGGTARERPTEAPSISTILVSGGRATAVTVSRREAVPHGTGDLLSGLLLGHMLSGCELTEALARAVHGVDVVVAGSVGHDELRLVNLLSHAITKEPLPLEPFVMTS